jgi:hypothetical protein
MSEAIYRVIKEIDVLLKASACYFFSYCGSGGWGGVSVKPSCNIISNTL